MLSETLRENCPYSEFFWSVFFRIRRYSISLCIQSKCGNIRTRKTHTNTIDTNICFYSFFWGWCWLFLWNNFKEIINTNLNKAEERKKFFWDFQSFLLSKRTKFCQKFGIQEEFKNHTENDTFCKFISSVKKISEQIKEFQEFKNHWPPRGSKPDLSH